MVCFTPGQITQNALDKLAHQYKNSPNLKSFFGVYLNELEAVQAALCNSFLSYSCDQAAPPPLQLDRIGALVGVARTYCNLVRAGVFGFNDGSPDCCNNADNVFGFCEGEWAGCNEFTNYSLPDDIYQRLICAKIIANKSTAYTINDVIAVAKALFGNDACVFVCEGSSELVISTGRALTQGERLVIALFFQVLPVAPVATATIIASGNDLFGFGADYLGFCGDFGMQFRSVDYATSNKIAQFGFGAEFSGFDEGVWIGDAGAALLAPGIFGFCGDPDTTGFCGGNWDGCDN